MQLVTSFLFLTLVAFVNSANAAPTDPSPDFRDAETQDAPVDVDPSKILSTSPTTPPPLPMSARRRAAPYFYRYRQDFSVGGAVIFGRNKEDNSQPQYIGAIQHQFANANLKSYVLSGEIMSDENGLISFSRRWNHSRARIRPYHQLGLSVIIDPEDQIATVLLLQHYLLRAQAGVELSMGGSFSLRLDALALVGTKSQQGGAGIATVWAF